MPCWINSRRWPKKAKVESNGYVQKVLSNMPNKLTPQSFSATSTAVQPIPLVNRHKPTLPYAAKANPLGIEQAGLAADNPQKTSPATVPTSYPAMGDPESPAQGSASAEQSVNVYGSKPSTVMVYQ
jgi:hypothetical protein